MNARDLRFWRKVDIGTGVECWPWTAGLTGAGYGIISWREDGKVRNQGAHRYAYEYLFGTIPEGLHLDHLCRNPRCVNPAHLDPVTPRVNALRGVGPSARNARATECKHGHPFTPENTWVDPKRNTRHCRECMRRRWREWNARRQEVAR